MNRHMYVECGQSIVGRLRKEVNGLIKFEIYPEADIIIIKIFFKEFDFNYAVKDIQDLIYNNGLDDTATSILKKYRSAILNGFFKTEARKERDHKKELGILEEEYV